MPRSRVFVFLIAASAPLFGCATTPKAMLDTPAVVLGVVGAVPLIDERARYRSLFCSALNRSGSRSTSECDEFLWRLPDEKPASALTLPAQDLSPSTQVLIVGGAFGDCFPPASIPFSDSVPLLRERGINIDYISVGGRSSAKVNAKSIAERILAIPSSNDQPLVLVGYSKGVVDILESLVGYPGAAKRVSAVISIAGAVNGSPLAQRYSYIYEKLFAKRSMRSCPAGDGEVLLSLERSERLNWIANNSLPRHIRYYSLATFTTLRESARALRHFQRQLSKIDPRNDGQLLAQDELIPGSILLGYANADHWAVALRVEKRFPFLAGRVECEHNFPQGALLESILLLVQSDLSAVASQKGL